jgi:tetratricopeptide (TPR) repeat protein
MKCETIEELERFFAIQEQALGKSSAEVATTMTKLGELYFQAGDFVKAESLNKRALEIRVSLSGSFKAEIAESERNIARIRVAQNPTEPESKPSSSIAQSEASPSFKSGDRVPRHNSGEIEYLLNAPESLSGAHKKAVAGDAAREMELEVSLLKEMVGAEHPSVADSLTKLADLYCRAKAYDKMEPVLLEALRVRELSYGPDQLKVSTELKNLAQLYVFQEKFSLAEPLFRRALAIREKHLGSSHKKVLDIQEQLVRILKRTGRPTQGEDLEKQIAILKNPDGITALSPEGAKGARLNL